VHSELQRRGAEIAYVKTTDGLEVDFLSRGVTGSETLIQVCADPDNPDTLEREVRALQAAAVEHRVERQLILTAASRLPFPEVSKPIEIFPAWQWMLEEETTREPPFRPGRS
jgi:predicted AAA+ superfamily ATPase